MAFLNNIPAMLSVLSSRYKDAKEYFVDKTFLITKTGKDCSNIIPIENQITILVHIKYKMEKLFV